MLQREEPAHSGHFQGEELRVFVLDFLFSFFVQIDNTETCPLCNKAIAGNEQKIIISGKGERTSFSFSFFFFFFFFLITLFCRGIWKKLGISKLI